MKEQLDKKIMELATTNWQQFLEIAGDEFIMTFKARILRKEGKSWQQISMQLKITPKQARVACKNLAAQKGQA